MRVVPLPYIVGLKYGAISVILDIRGRVADEGADGGSVGMGGCGIWP